MDGLEAASVRTDDGGRLVLESRFAAVEVLLEVLKRAGDQYNRGRLTPIVAKLLSTWLAWRR